MSMEEKTINFQKDQVICLEGDLNYDLYKINNGKLIVFVLNGSQVNPLAILENGDLFGELSFFDHKPRSANVIALEDTEVVQISNKSIENILPSWLMMLSKSITNKIRKTDALIANHRIRKKKNTQMMALSIEQQTHLFQLVKKRSKSK